MICSSASGVVVVGTWDSVPSLEFMRFSGCQPSEGYPNLPGYPTMSVVVSLLCMNRYFENLVSIKYYFINR